MELESRLALRELAPELGDARRVRKLVDPIHEEERGVIDAEVAVVHEGRQEVADEVLRPLALVALAQEHLVVASIPSSRPVLVRPAAAERACPAGRTRA